MAGEFAATNLGRLLSFANGRSSPDRAAGLPYPVYGSNGIIGYSSESNASANSIIIGRVGSYCGSLYLSRELCWVTDNAIRATAIDGNDPRFLFHLLGTLNLNNLRAGSGQPLLNQDILRRIPAAVPELGEQRAIAHILGALDDKIELNRRTNETLEAMARALFKSWFVDFDPVRAKIEGRDPGLPKEVVDLFSGALEDSELGKIPSGWLVKTMGDLAEIVGGSTPSTTEPAYWDGGIHYWATPKDLSALSIPVLSSTERCISDAGLAQISSGLLPAGTVLLSSRAPIGYLAIAEVPVAINQGFIGMKPLKGVPNLFLLLWAHFAHDEILSYANGSTFLEINKANFRLIPIAAPPIEVLDAFDHLARPLHERIVANERESQVLAALRDALLPKLISGELRVKDAERLVEANA
jgi:type I restriction enzyme S subunit